MKREQITYKPGHFAAPVFAWWPDFKPQLSPEPEWMLKRRTAGQKGAEAARVSTTTSYFSGYGRPGT